MDGLPVAEARAITLLQEHRVLDMNALREGGARSRMTVLRGLKRYGYFSSYNCNSSYYTLQDIPQFDGRGLWQFGAARFSRYGTLARTMVAWVQGSARGLSAQELEEGLGVRVHNHASQLIRSGELARTRIGARVIYVAGGMARRTEQEALWRGGVQGPAAGLGLPEGIAAMVLLRLLVEMIRAPEASAASLARRVTGQGEQLTAEQVRRVIAFWKLDEKRGTCR